MKEGGIIDSEIGSTMAQIAHARNEKERKALRKRISFLRSKKNEFLKQCDTYEDHMAWEKSIMEICGMTKNYLDESEMED